MSRRAINWSIILVALVVACINPFYRHHKDQPIVTLGLDLKGGVEVLLEATPEVDKTTNVRPPVTVDQMEGAQEVVRNRVDPSGTKELYISKVGADRLLLQVPGEKNPDAIIKVLGDTALLEFLDTGSDSLAEGTDLDAEGSSQRKPEYAKYETIVTGADLAKSYTEFSNNKPTIAFQFKPDAADKFGNFTNNHVNQYLTIVLDGKVLTSPVIKNPIWGGSGIIEGSFTMETADKIVKQLNAGALPVPLTILSSSVVGPTLGQDSIDKSFFAGIAGFVIVLLFMLIFYRLPGAIATVTLVLYIVLALGFMSLINATLTLPGIAGFLLSVGMAIDANIIIFERLKEEIRWGKTLVAAMDAAFARAWVAIFDGHVTTIIAATVLFMLGTGPIKGFAVVLVIGSLMALFSGVFITRSLLEFMVRHVNNVHLYAPVTAELEIPSVLLREGKYFKYAEYTPAWVTASSVLVAAGIVFMVLNSNDPKIGGPFREGIDFTGGESIILQSKQAFPVDGQAVATLVQKYAEGEATVQVDANNPKLVSIRMRIKASGATESEMQHNKTDAMLAMRTDIGNAFGGFSADPGKQNPLVLEENYVGPTVGPELIKNALWALFWGNLCVFLYIFIRFQSRWQMGLAAILALIHDILITLAFTAALKLEVNSSFIAVILTIIGYSVNDTIIIFDRIRENLRNFGDKTPLSQLCNLSLSQTFTRSINTVVTVVVMICSLLIFGGGNIKDFMIAMLVGMVSGAYSSIYIATPLMLWLSKGKLSKDDRPIVLAAAAGAGTIATVEPDSVVKQAVEREVEKRKDKSDAKQQRRR